MQLSSQNSTKLNSIWLRVLMCIKIQHSQMQTPGALGSAPSTETAALAAPRRDSEGPASGRAGSPTAAPGVNEHCFSLNANYQSCAEAALSRDFGS